MNKSKRRTCSIFFLVAMLFPMMAVAFSNDPMDSIPLPAGTNAFVFYYNHVSADDFYKDGHKDSLNGLLNPSMTADVGVYRWVSYYDIAGLRNTTNVIVPFGSSSVDTTYPDPTTPFNVNLTSPSGLGDITLEQSVWFVNKPDQLFFMTGCLYVTAPTGEYDNDRALNVLAANRWAFKPGLSIAKGFNSTGTIFEFGVFEEFYTENDNYTPAGLKNEQDPLFKIEAVLNQFLDPKTFVSLSYFYDNGGETKVNGVMMADKTNSHSLQLAFTRMVTDNTQIMIKYRSDLNVENGFKSDTVGIRLAYVFPPAEKK